jgi:pre-mRNA-processing factor 19
LGANDGTTKLYNIAENSLVETLSSHNAELNSIAFSENGFYFATGSHAEGIVNVWDLRKLGLVKSLLTGKFKLKEIKFFKYSNKLLNKKIKNRLDYFKIFIF